MKIFNPFLKLYDYFFVNHSIQDQDDMRLADLAMIEQWKRLIEKNKIKRYTIPRK